MAWPTVPPLPAECSRAPEASSGTKQYLYIYLEVYIHLNRKGSLGDREQVGPGWVHDKYEKMGVKWG